MRMHLQERSLDRKPGKRLKRYKENSVLGSL